MRAGTMRDAPKVGGLSGLGQADTAQCIQAIAERGDPASFASIFQQFAPKIRNYHMRFGIPFDVAEEISQETMLVIWKKARLYNPAIASATAWIYAISKNLLIDYLRTHNRKVPAQLHEDVSFTPGPEQALSTKQTDSMLRGAMHGLPTEQELAIRLSYFEDMSHAHIARLLQLPLGTVKSRIRLASVRLRASLDEGRLPDQAMTAVPG